DALGPRKTLDRRASLRRVSLIPYTADIDTAKGAGNWGLRRRNNRPDNDTGARFIVLFVARSRQVCIYWLWKHCLFCRDCLWRERTSIYSWRFALVCWQRPVSPHWRRPVASPAITLRLTGDHLVDDA